MGSQYLGLSWKTSRRKNAWTIMHTGEKQDNIARASILIVDLTKVFPWADHKLSGCGIPPMRRRVTKTHLAMLAVSELFTPSMLPD